MKKHAALGVMLISIVLVAVMFVLLLTDWAKPAGFTPSEQTVGEGQTDNGESGTSTETVNEDSTTGTDGEDEASKSGETGEMMLETTETQLPEQTEELTEEPTEEQTEESTPEETEPPTTEEETPAPTEPPTEEETPAPTVAPTTQAAADHPSIEWEPKSDLRQELTMTEQEALARGKVIYLTFDDGPGKYTPWLLEILDAYNVKVTFFVTGAFPEWYHMMAEEKAAGHTVAIHTYFHDYEEIYSCEEEYFADLKRIDDIVFAQIGEHVKLLRFPGGSSNRVSIQYNIGIMTRLTKMVEDKGYHYFDWNVDSDDAGNTHTTEKVIENVLYGIKKHDISVVLQHDLHDYSVAAVEDIIIWGLENGYVFLPLTMDSPVVHHTIAN